MPFPTPTRRSAFPRAHLLGAALAASAVPASALWSCASPQPQAANPEEQIAQALAAAPEDKAEGARVLGYAADGSVIELRPGSNHFVCLASNPASESFQSSCYHASLEPYFARGRELSAADTPHGERYAIRFREMDEGALPKPEMSATQYILDGEWDSATRTAAGALRWVIYIPGATPESTGLSETPRPGAPWIMQSGTPGAHIMIMPPQPGGEPPPSGDPSAGGDPQSG